MSASLPVKCHLPLITTWIEFQFNILSPHPQITLRRDLGAVIHCQAWRATPYTRLKLKGKPVTARRDESPLTDVTSSDADESDVEKSDVEELTAPLHKILKPKGEAGKSNRGGYNLKDAMGWENKEYATFSVSQVTHVLKVNKLCSQ